MKQISTGLAFISCIVLAGLFTLSCSKKDRVLNIQSISNSSSTANKPSPPPPPPANPAIVFQSGSSLMVMNADGSNQTQILTGNISYPKWSPDGKSILFTGLGWNIGGVSSALLRIDVNVGSNGVPFGSNLRNAVPLNLAGGITTYGAASFSPGGDSITFIGINPDNKRCVYITDTSGGGLSLAYSPATGFGPMSPDWSSDGSKLVFCELNSSAIQMALKVVDRNTSLVTTVLPFSSLMLGHPSWSHGDRIAFDSELGNNSNLIYTVTLSNVNPVFVAVGVYPTWSSDDSKMAFVSGKLTGVFNPDGIYCYTFSNGTRVKLSGGGAPNWKKN